MVQAELKIKNTFLLKDLNIRVGLQDEGKNLVNGEVLREDNKSAELLEKNYMQSYEFINKLNSYIDSNEDSIDTTNWLKWIKSNDGYPTLNFE